MTKVQAKTTCMYGGSLSFASLPERRSHSTMPSPSSSSSLEGLAGLVDRMNTLCYSLAKKQKLRQLWSDWVSIIMMGRSSVSVARSGSSSSSGGGGTSSSGKCTSSSSNSSGTSGSGDGGGSSSSTSSGSGISSGSSSDTSGSSGSSASGSGSGSGGRFGGTGSCSSIDSGSSGSSGRVGGTGSCSSDSGSGGRVGGTGSCSSSDSGSSGRVGILVPFPTPSYTSKLSVVEQALASLGSTGGGGIGERRVGCYMGDAVDEGVYHSRRQFFSAFMFMLGEGRVFLRLGGHKDFIEQHSVVQVRRKTQKSVADSEFESDDG